MTFSFAEMLKGHFLSTVCLHFVLKFETIVFPDTCIQRLKCSKYVAKLFFTFQQHNPNIKACFFLEVNGGIISYWCDCDAIPEFTVAINLFS